MEKLQSRAANLSAEKPSMKEQLADGAKQAAETYPFTGMIRCGKCGAPYGRIQTATGTKYNKTAWFCATANKLGVSICDSQRIPEDIMMAKAAEMLGLTDFDEIVFREQIAVVQVPAHNRLCFVFRDGDSAEVDWQHQSRSNSWTPEMKQAARERQLKINGERRKRDATTE